ncbi:NtaA/DmoA family FMN-dependent monooxygenase [Amycolatopsis granulosa]|uniref:NtaA/DmoA family FMN-dependent monooxygenase n=1 Tax=Amycolatopsis granulosa TaxID=185684 RepID=UPI00141F5113|nr:FMN-dependent oxidoreductase (nitrilotriacetate monooxygenase family) [Amycolatopsis granulosa]
MTRQLHLNAFLVPPGANPAAWRHPAANAAAGVDFASVLSFARTAERAKFDAVFLGDLAGVPLESQDVLSRVSAVNDVFEPITLLGALAAATDHIGLIGTASTTCHEPYHLARAFASIDHISGGRAGWHVVTSLTEGEALNFGLDVQAGDGTRYERAGEFLDIVTGLWDSFDDDAFHHDQATGVYFDPAKLHPLNYRGKHLSVAGPLNIARPPQGRPVIAQAGDSAEQKGLAARFAEVVLAGNRDLAAATEFYAELKERAAGFGRAPESLVVLPALSVITAPTEDEARAKRDQLGQLMPPEVALAHLARTLDGVDLSGYPIDGPLPELPEPGRPKGTRAQVYRRARERGLTIRQLAAEVSDDATTLVGTPAAIADHIEEWFRAPAADGFTLVFPYLPGALEDFVDLVVPELRRRGLFRDEYDGTTLRDHFGLSRPVSRHG